MKHKVYVNTRGENRHYWACNCGCSGSVPSNKDVDIAADNHIKYKSGHTRVNVSKLTT